MKLVLLFLPFLLFALDLSEILTHPKSYVRDFYLTEFMRETNSSTLAYKAYSALYRPKMYKHMRLLSQKSDEFKKVYRCINVKPSYLRDVDISCVLNNGLSLGSIAKLDKKDLKYLYKSLPDGRLKKSVGVILYKKYSTVLNNRDLGYYFMLRYPVKAIDRPVKDISKFYGKYFYLFVWSAVTHDLKKIQRSLLRADYKKADDRAKWWLFLNAMKNGRYKLAEKILYAFDNKDSRILFWLWRLGNIAALQELLQKKRVDFYTLFAYESAEQEFYIRSKILYNTVKNPKYDQTNPWDVLKFWDELKKRDDLFDFAKELDSEKSVALKAIVLDKAFEYKHNFFITPDIYNDSNTSFRSMVYAIARQESRFIPASVSGSYALGTMQIMPFLIRDMKGDVFSQFDYGENIRLGVKHLKWLFSQLKHPLFVAYAYNGGIGFTKRKVIKNFKFKGEFEPFLSMELVPYKESREYGKKVLANYVIYNHLFGDKNVTLHKLLKK